MKAQHQVIHIHPDAPPKPAIGKACNGCGVCCLSAPCPVGILVSRRWHGACIALRWADEDQRYVCGMLTAPLQSLGWQREGRVAGWLGVWLERGLARLSARWIAAGKGCDADLETLMPIQPGQATSSRSRRDG